MRVPLIEAHGENDTWRRVESTLPKTGASQDQRVSELGHPLEFLRMKTKTCRRWQEIDSRQSIRVSRYYFQQPLRSCHRQLTAVVPRNLQRVWSWLARRRDPRQT